MIMQRIDELMDIAQLLVQCVLSLGDFRQIQNVTSLRNDVVYGLKPSDRTDEVSTDLVG